MKRIRVLIVEDSRVVGEHLRRIIVNDPRFIVVGLAVSGEEALQMVEQLSPDVISMDIQLPGMQGFEATRRIMALRPTPIVIVSGAQSEDIPLTMKALQAGALAVVEKPVATSHEDYSALAGRLCTQLAIMSDVRVVRQREIALKAAPLITQPGSIWAGARKLLAIAASTGGPSALMRLLSGLGENFPLPIAIVQHMTPAFMTGFVDWLGSVTPLPISIVQEPTALRGGRVYLASAGDAHLVIQGMVAAPGNTPPVGNHRPAASVLFSSIAHSLGGAAIGVQLTGMGEDGATGLRELKNAGAYTIAEDEASAVVYSMPAAAVRLGAITESLPLGDIAPRVLELVRAGRGTA